MVQKCQVGFARLRDANSKVAKLEAEKKELQAAFDAKDEQLREEVHKNTALAANLETETPEVDKLKTEVQTQVRLAVDLISERNKERDGAKSALEEQNAGYEAALERQKAELVEKF